MPLEAAVEESVRYLSSEEALASLDRDPYWPKWHSPWWHILALHEMGRASKVPLRTLDRLIDRMNAKYLRFFPTSAEPLPAGKSDFDVACHCQLGTMYQALHACGVEVDVRLPWIRPWFMKYQLPDGGLNCDESAYANGSGASSVLSTVPVLEAMLVATGRPFTEAEKKLVDGAAQYLIERRLFRSKRSGEIIDPSWLKLTFPRFYGYDHLRGLRAVARWAVVRQKSVSRAAVAESLELLEREFGDRALWPERKWYAEIGSHQPDGSAWKRGESSTFPLLEVIGAAGEPNKPLTLALREAREDLATLAREDLLTSSA